MGSTVQATCPCGFESDLLRVGGGMTSFDQVCLAPALAERTGEIAAKNFWGKSRRGNRLGKFTFYTDTRLHEPLGEEAEPELVFGWRGREGKPDFDLPDIRYLCPACGEMSMGFSLGNLMWD
jgi:hypothetical protein